LTVDVQKFFMRPDSSIRDVMVCIDRNAKGIALIVDQAYRLVGTITDGDIRRAVLSGTALDSPISELLQHKADSRYPEPITAVSGTSSDQLLRIMREQMVRQIPLLDQERRVVGLATMDELFPREQLPLQAVIMAGGFGTRLRPLTEKLPKPMLPVGDRPLLELTIQRMREAGIRQVNITTHHQPERIVEHFGNGETLGVDINYVTEDSPLGTAGALSLIEMPDTPLLVINGDILTKVDFRAMLDYHRKHNADLTVGVRQYSQQVPYGVVECDGAYVQQVREKPVFSFLVNAGIYLMEPTVHRYVPQDQRFDMTDLIQQLVQDGCSVVSFPIVEYWLDIGQHTDYERAQKDVQEGRFQP
jgi:dTDP-glucose pyrophosphorylase/CBS domain-containing protein